MRKPVLLDLFCKAGGAGKGYADAGFDVVGVDIEDQPNYPFAFCQADAIDFLRDVVRGDLGGIDAIHASPPCQHFTTGAAQHGTQDDHPDLIEDVRYWLKATHLPYVIENVEGAPLADGPTIFGETGIVLCGTMFDLGVFRHRRFEANWSLLQPGHPKHRGRVGDGKYVTVAGHAGGSSTRDGIVHGDTAAWKRAMDIDWMTMDELAQAIPPAYTEFIGAQLLAHVAEVAA